MNAHAILLGLAITTVALVAAQDIGPLLQNRSIVDRQIGCILHRNPCDVIGRQIKALIPEALFNGCARCAPQQMSNAKKLMTFMIQNYPSEWESILAMYSKPKSVY